MTHTDSALTPRRELWLLLTVAGVQFTHIVDFMIIMPLGPQFTQLFQISDAQFGTLVSAYTLSAGVSGLASATYVDRVDRKQLLLTLYGLFALATLACGLAEDYVMLLLARIAAGTFGGVLSALVQTIVADVIPFERRGRAMGIVMSSFSAATVAGVPLGLWLANHLGWHAAFISIALVSGLIAVAAFCSLPSMGQHLDRSGQRRSVLSGIQQVLAEPNHRRAFLFSGLLMSAGFTVIPFITIYLQTNVGVVAEDIPYLYLFGGAATLVTARWVGRLTDRHGKVRMFGWVALAVTLPLIGLTVLPPTPFWVVVVVTTAFFVGMGGRMIPGMAIVTSAAAPAMRGTFMALNSACQSAAMGLASFVGGQIIARDANGQVLNYALAGLLGGVLMLLSVWVARHLVLHGAPPGPQRVNP
ncbi:MFS transporter [Hydrogenophaga sp. 5NK40-0174]|uniref:MFS transporter n=1 Tax=Hydrogenophaga sp. 5NK40-0174 TaxID=3127649 RepID=UPI00310608DB